MGKLRAPTFTRIDVLNLTNLEKELATGEYSLNTFFEFYSTQSDLILREINQLKKLITVLSKRKHIQISYSSTLSNRVLQYRISNNNWELNNICVFEYENLAGNSDYIFGVSKTSGAHSEKDAYEKLIALSIPTTKIKAVYSELDLCIVDNGGFGNVNRGAGHGGCSHSVQELFPPFA